MTVLQLAIILSWTVCAVGLAVYAAAIAREITYVTLADGRKTERKIPLLMRLLLPLVPNLARFVSGRAFERPRREAEWMLVAAGLEGLLSATEFVALKFLMPLVCGGAWCLSLVFLGTLVPDSFFSQNLFVLCLLGVAWFYVYPLVWLRGALRRRHLEITRALIQADELGVSIGSILRIQSEQLRGRRFDRAEKLANEAPVKMLGPLILCIFPAVFIILLGPIVLQAAKSIL